MSRQIMAFALALILIFGMLSADNKAVASSTVGAATPGPIEDVVEVAGAPTIGNSGTIESPVGSAGLGSGWGAAAAAAAAAGAMNAAATDQPPSSNGATTVTVSPTFVGAAVTACYYVF
ncbi:hypothetical protein V6N13_102061 [Hibiscus sabdariffa]|uniref:Uncharacterized protein n=1 Tax=Hibiscus sabdariffa TaxID=183260 RepID=A0ABR2D2X1_9ROSI